MKKLLSCLFIIFCVAASFFSAAQPSFSDTMKFAQLSDVHYSLDRDDTSFKLLSHSKELLEDAVNQINEQKNIKFVIVTGDGIDSPQKTALAGLITGLNELKFPWYITLGNHDTVNSSEVDKKTFFKTIKENNKNFPFENSYYTFKPQRGFRVIVMDGASDNRRAPDAFFPKDQLQWIDNILSKSKNDVVLIFQHFPIVTPYSSKGHEIKNADEYYAVLKKYTMPIAVFSGHYHAAKITKDGNIIHASAPALVTYPNSFRIIEIENNPDKAVFKFEFFETTLKDLQETAKIRIVGDSLLLGKPNDRETVITIEKKKD